MKKQVSSILMAALLAGAAVGCASNDDLSREEVEAIEQEELAGLEQGLGAIAGDRVTRFATTAEFVTKLEDLSRSYRLDQAQGKALRDGLGTLSDLVAASDVFALSQLGTAVVGDTPLLSAATLTDQAAERLAAVHAEDEVAAQDGLGQTSQALTGVSWTAEDRQYPYKMIGYSYHDTTPFQGNVGARTEFQKHREKYWWLGKRWYNLEANRMSLRVVAFYSNTAQYLHEAISNNDDLLGHVVVSCISTGSCHSDLSPWGMHSWHAVDHGAYTFRVQTANNVNDNADYKGYATGYYIPW
jgi:hypothetical protein